MATLQTYKGGGYVINFERSFRRNMRNLTRLRSKDWLDLRTRAIFIEFTVYNPNANLYASVVLVAEFPAVGAVVPRSEFKVQNTTTPTLYSILYNMCTEKSHQLPTDPILKADKTA